MTTIADGDGVLMQDPLEHRAEVLNLDALQTVRRNLVEQYAPLAAKFKGGAGNGSSSDAARKRHRALIAKSILIEQFGGDKKEPSETALERMANADPRHIEFCDDLERQFAKFIVLENEIADVNEQIRDREERMRVYRAELGLAR